MSLEKLSALRAESTEIKSVKIPLIARRIDEARQMGDLSENAEYHAAREEMSWARARFEELSFILENAIVIEEAQNTAKKGATVQLGSTIIVSINNKEKTYMIVGAQEADPGAGKISNESPLGQAFLGKAKGDPVEVKVPSGMQVYTITEIK
ncbi:MAG: hypothetical protein A2821_03990 [Candidatus Magasanikbacteria bacterium RIFCSPHIGHO2_01_FULL_41_23]|nr:MAG: hypothetical protein A2821_03990 [Candidatus Magasanikbacteria bacterium RIFCSPHIGHO2_01_FULL_41_23]OGH74958.1 MAG: hypothetical protein A3F22_02665 [Candidatus Magasanikbacteria bacterium RIFCSPHIGHO2_12_FULL_41_16]